MNAEELEIARRLVACKGWVWLPGMLATTDITSPLTPVRVGSTGDGGVLFYDRGIKSARSRLRAFCAIGLLPDLSDDLTRLGVLAVVRRAWGQDDLAARRDGSGTWAVIPENSEWWSGCRDSELEALTRALEAAP